LFVKERLQPIYRASTSNVFCKKITQILDEIHSETAEPPSFDYV
jgi:hypothetical protein